MTDKSPNKLETDLSFAHYGCKFNIVMDEPKKNYMERISIEARHKYDGEPTKVLNELIVYVTKSPTFAFRHLGGRAAKYEIATSSEHVIGIVMYAAEFNKGQINGESMSKLVDTYPTYLLYRTDLKDFPMPKVLPRIRCFFNKNMVTLTLLQHFVKK